MHVRYGLGNQLLQYAAGLYFAEKYGATLEVVARPEDRSSFGHPRPFLLKNFLLSSPQREATFFERKLLRRKAEPLFSLLGIEILHCTAIPGFYEDLQHSPDAKYLHINGFFFSYRYAQLLEGRLRNELRFRAEPSGQNLAGINRIRDSDCAVSLHIRRGDYKNSWGGQNVLSMAYYERAIAAIYKFHARPTFFVFSDDIGFARESLTNLGNVVFMDTNDEMSAVEDLRLMSSCRHHIIANSTFSWWGAWLNPNPDKVVMVPDPCFQTEDYYIDLIPPTWRRISARP